MKKFTITFAIVALLLTGCGMFDKPSPTDPVERGCEKIAAAIVMAALIRGCMNK